jgi:hypothetical protein
MSDVDLDDDKVANYGDMTPFLPWGPGKYLTLFKGVTMARNAQGERSFMAYFEVLESSREDVAPEDIRAVRCKIDAEGWKKNVERGKLRKIMLAVENLPPDPDTSVNPVLSKWRDIGEDAAQHGVIVEIVAFNRRTKNGVEITEYNFRNATGDA